MTVARDASEAMSVVLGKAYHFANDSRRSNARFTTAEFLGWAADALRELQQRRGIASKESALGPLEITYPASSDTLELAGLLGGSVVLVQDIGVASAPKEIPLVPLAELETPPVRRGQNRDPSVGIPRRCALTATTATVSSAPSLRISPRPNAAISLRVWALSQALIATADSDTFPLRPEWQELVALMMAMRARAPHPGEESSGVIALHNSALELFTETCQVPQGKRRITNVRRS